VALKFMIKSLTAPSYVIIANGLTPPSAPKGGRRSSDAVQHGREECVRRPRARVNDCDKEEREVISEEKEPQRRRRMGHQAWQGKRECDEPIPQKSLTYLG